MADSPDTFRGRANSTSPGQDEWEREFRRRGKDRPKRREIIEGDDPSLFVTIIPPIPSKFETVLGRLRSFRRRGANPSSPAAHTPASRRKSFY